MKKIIAIMIICIISFSALGASVQDIMPYWGSSLLNDSAELLKGSTKDKIDTRLTKISSKYKMDVVIVTVKGTGKSTNEEFADDYFDYGGFKEDGVLLLINTDPNGIYISTSGKAMKHLTDYGLDKIISLTTPALKKSEYGEAFNTYLDLVDEFLGEAKDNKPYDTNHKYRTTGDVVKTILLVLLISLLVAAGIVWWMVRSMNTVRKQPGAKEYSKDLNLTSSSDIFLYSHTTSRRIPKSSGGGSSSHSGSSGRSHGGRGGSF